MILDVGCGAGHYQEVSTFRGQVNLDILKPCKIIPNFVLADCHNLPFKEKSFHKVYFMDVIEHVESPLKCLQEIKRVTNGAVLLGTPNSLFFTKILRTILRGSYVPYPEHIVTFGIPELSNLLERAGFSDFEIEATTYQDTRRSMLFRLFRSLVPPALRGRQLLARIHVKPKEKCAPVLFVSFIITTCRHRIKTLESLKGYPFPFEIIVSRKAGLGYARNYGASQARGNVLVFLDDDLKLAPRMLFMHIASLIEGTFKVAYQHRMPATRCLIIFKRDFEKVKFCNEIQHSGEDREFFMQAVKTGLDYVFLSSQGLYEHIEHEIRFKRDRLISIKTMYEHAKVLATHGAYMRFYAPLLSWLIPYKHSPSVRKRDTARTYGASGFWYLMRDAFLIFTVLTLRRYRRK